MRWVLPLRLHTFFEQAKLTNTSWLIVASLKLFSLQTIKKKLTASCNKHMFGTFIQVPQGAELQFACFYLGLG